MTETMLIKLIGTAMGRNTKTLIQIVIAKLYVTPFLPYWQDITDACEARQGGAPRRGEGRDGGARRHASRQGGGGGW